MARRLRLCLAAIFLAGCQMETESPGLLFHDAWVRSSPPGTPMTAAFGRLENTGANALEISSWSSPSYAEVSLHATRLENGVSRMRAVPALTLGAGESVALEPGGLHLMLMRPVPDAAPDENVALQARTADGRTFRFVLPVERR